MMPRLGERVSYHGRPGDPPGTFRVSAITYRPRTVTLEEIGGPREFRGLRPTDFDGIDRFRADTDWTPTQ